MIWSSFALIALVVFIGCGVPIQAGANATLAKFQGHPLLAAFTNTAVASLVLVSAASLLRVPLPSLDALGRAPSWAWCGGLIGATLVLSAVVIAPKLGAATYVSAMVVGTLLASTLIDHFGLVGFREHAFSWARGAGCVLLIAGLVLIQTN